MVFRVALCFLISTFLFAQNEICGTTFYVKQSLEKFPEKQKILEQHKEDKLLERIMYLAYNPMLNFYITGDALDEDYPNNIAELDKEGAGISKAFEPHDTIFNDLMGRVVTGHAAKNACLKVCAKLLFYLINYRKLFGKMLV